MAARYLNLVHPKCSRHFPFGLLTCCVVISLVGLLSHVHWKNVSTVHMNVVKDQHGIVPIVLEDVQTACQLNKSEISRRILMNTQVLGGRVPTKKTHKAKQCHDYNISVNIHHVVYRDIYNSHVLSHDITLATTSTIGRQVALFYLILNWDGPLSIVLYMAPEDLDQITQFVCDARLLRRQNIGLHIVPAQGVYYPVNHLRNIALQESKTKFTFLNDVDFVPMAGSHDRIAHYTRTGLVGNHSVAVVPAFETDDLISPPSDKAGLLAAWNSTKSVRPFHWDSYRPGHFPTNFNKWRTAVEPYEGLGDTYTQNISHGLLQIRWHEEFEPYVVVDTASCPRYSKTFVGRYYNKVSYIRELAAKSYQLHVIPDVFILHLPHTKITIYEIGKCTIERYRVFREQLKKSQTPEESSRS